MDGGEAPGLDKLIQKKDFCLCVCVLACLRVCVYVSAGYSVVCVYEYACVFARMVRV